MLFLIPAVWHREIYTALSGVGPWLVLILLYHDKAHNEVVRVHLQKTALLDVVSQLFHGAKKNGIHQESRIQYQ